MIRIRKVDVHGYEAAIRGVRNSFESWENSDTNWEDFNNKGFPIGEKDMNILIRLAKSGGAEAKFRRMITVTMDILAPFYWWKQFDTYKIATTSSSTSTMHAIHRRDLVLADFSTDHLLPEAKDALRPIIDLINRYRRNYNFDGSKEYWWQIIQLLPESYNQLRTIHTNYETLANIYKQRTTHKLDEWKEFCKWIESLPYSCLITLKGVE